VIDYVQKRDGVSFEDALAILGQPRVRDFGPHWPAPPKVPTKPDGDWQAKAKALVADCERALWLDGFWPEKARAYLREERGLSDEVIQAARLGYNPQARNIHGLWCEKGIVIPCFVGAELYRVKVKLPRVRGYYTTASGSKTRDKYKSVSGGRGGFLYLADWMTGKPYVIVTEGEFDALLVWQAVSDFADVITLGGSNEKLADKYLPCLLSGKQFWIGSDNDEAGQASAEYWRSKVGKKYRRLSPPAKDWTDAWQAGVDLRAFFSDELERSWFKMMIDVAAGVYVGRGNQELDRSLLANPYKIGVDGTREECIQRYTLWLRRQWQNRLPARNELMRLVNLYRRDGKLTLVCHCAPLSCHAEVIKRAIERIIQKTGGHND
jgi:hypothetical protein